MGTATAEVIGRDLNETIATAMQARVEAAVAAELSSSDLFKDYVRAALLQPLTKRVDYKDVKTTFLRETIDEAIRGAAKTATLKYIEGEMEALEAIVATELRRQTKSIAAGLVEQLAEQAKRTYGIEVKVRYPSDN